MAGIIHATVALTSGTRLGPYEILAFLGAGGMGEVYRAHDSHLHRDVALKVLASLSSDSDRLRRFEAYAEPYFGTQVEVAPDGSVLLTRDVGTQEVYALGVKWP
jgi:serine/threonine protein kinase